MSDASKAEPLMTPEEVASFLSISKATLCRLTKASKIPHKRLGPRIVRYQREEIEAWVENQEPQTAATE